MGGISHVHNKHPSKKHERFAKTSFFSFVDKKRGGDRETCRGHLKRALLGAQKGPELHTRGFSPCCQLIGKPQTPALQGETSSFSRDNGGLEGGRFGAIFGATSPIFGAQWGRLPECQRRGSPLRLEVRGITESSTGTAQHRGSISRRRGTV